MFREEQKVELAKPLDYGLVKTRPQANKELMYIEGHEVIETANRIFGYGMWSDQITELVCVHEWTGEVASKTGGPDRVRFDVTYRCRVKITVSAMASETVVYECSYEDVGAGHGQSYLGYGDAHESAMKEAATDAMKRCFRKLGQQFGLGLYNKDVRDKIEKERKGTKGTGNPQRKPASPGKKNDQITDDDVKKLYSSLMSTDLADKAKAILKEYKDKTGTEYVKDMEPAARAAIYGELDMLKTKLR